ncbi:NAD(P)/FAD-dependent oxidoreductase [Helicobacter didelphidarum]|uniref:NADH:ubiquinone reductase (non-electrogenic) n=1 Tax=Helicobacter didelphidarum TaxID=2040648 RepID=A0A3D8ILV3_9HELI|nr:FAD-dependent oxidoreductase [Helicobacter didelphidarum]RDU66208.1 NAD(P)/FAD-dependent oxidoreductase [Helicobacter didelphidarum]
MKKVLLLGAGYANMKLLTSINKEIFSQVQWTLINNTPYHYKTIALHDVASGKHNRSVLFPLKDVLDRRIEIIEDYVERIESHTVIAKNGSYEYDYLIVGLGFSSDSFGIPGVVQYTQSITSYNSAREIQDKITQALQRYLQSKEINDLSFVVCGGGFTGIEFVGSLAQELKKQCRSIGIDFSLVKIYCIEAMPKILPMFSENLMHVALQKLTELGVSVLMGSKILECRQGCVVVEQNGKQNEIFANTIIWTAGVKGNEVIANSPFFESARSKVAVDEWLQPTKLNFTQQDSHTQEILESIPKLHNIFIIGDCAAVKDEKTGRFYPPTAQISAKQGEYVGQLLETLFHAQKTNQEIQKDSLPKFEFEARGSICSIGQGYAVGVVNNKEIKGFSANCLKWLIESQWGFALNGLGGVFRAD